MIKLVALRLLKSDMVAPRVLRYALRLQNILYDLIGILAKTVEGGTHPKQRIIRYQDWFCDQVKPGWNIIDIGSNTGKMTAQLAQRVNYVYGIEISRAMIQAANHSYVADNLEFLLGDATTFDYSNCLPIDCVTLSNVLEHIPRRVDFLIGLRRNLPWRNTNECNFLLRVPTIERDWLAAFKKEFGVEYRLDRTHEIEYTREEFLEEVNKAGLTVESFHVRFGEFYAVCKGTGT